MEGSVIRRHRWVRLALVATVLLAGARFAWHFRPLNAEERKLVGAWGVFVLGEWGSGLTHDGWPVDGAVLTPDRRFSIHLDCQSRLRPGSWRISGNELFLRYDIPFDWVTFPRCLVDLVTGNDREERYDIEFKTAGAVRVHRGGQNEHTWIRQE